MPSSSIMLSQLIPDLNLDRDVPVSGVSADSRKLLAGNVFLAIPGDRVDGRAFIGEVRAKASAVLCEPPIPPGLEGPMVIAVSGLQAKAGEIASRFFGEPSRAMNVIAVTGTNGKTSVSMFIADAMTRLGTRCGVVGTLGTGIVGALRQTGMTTPDAITMQSSLADLKDIGCGAVAVEASSHGLAQGRLNGTSIDVAIFTNLTRDHLDYHGDEQTYGAAKRSLFSWPGLNGAVVNIDDPFGADIAASLTGVSLTTCGSAGADVMAVNLEPGADGIRFDLVTPWGSARIHSSLFGRFNVANLLATAGTLAALEFKFDEIIRVLPEIAPVPGRMNVVRSPGLPIVIVDYAHTPDALANALRAAREHCRGSLWCVFGCGGDRDNGKRPMMGSVAEAAADHLMVTDDNPRSESAPAIVREILGGMKAPGKALTISPRGDAIRSVLGQADPEDVVLIAGKGHETYQEINGERIPYSDFEVVREMAATRTAPAVTGDRG
ncbi:MAG: UDP-N-acetylmuramoyl-L-alanyl-D-glutamate--2,6-diaminopimelate ligase [Proteobacteria bacterium]|nr:UDP-N-acetylmuramoyl-L-alanyl-D-glutamate--2,6-diaminopimelate ligase [Pseudomonadota bacterium]